MPDSVSNDVAAVVIWAASRALRRKLRPLAWMALEEVALEAVAEDGRLVARTSARQVAERMGVDPGTAAGALRALRRHGLLMLEREHGPAGRFGLSVYVLGSIDGFTVASAGMAACVGVPSPATPGAGQPGAAAAGPSGPGLVRPGGVTPCTGDSHTARPHTKIAGSATVESARAGRRPETSGIPQVAPASECPGQTALDLGSVSS